MTVVDRVVTEISNYEKVSGMLRMVHPFLSTYDYQNLILFAN